MPEGYDIGPDPEAGESLSEMQEEFRREQAALDDQWRRELLGTDRELAVELEAERAMNLEDATEEAWAAMKPGDPIPVLNSCDALRVIDGVPLTPPEDEE